MKAKTKIITINALTAKALDGSIKKWKQCVKDARDGDKSGASAGSCALCQVFNKRYNSGDRTNVPDRMTYQPVGKSPCGGCPVFKDTRKWHCGGTPYVAYEECYNEDRLEDRAKAELAYLKDLKKRCVVKEDSK